MAAARRSHRRAVGLAAAASMLFSACAGVDSPRSAMYESVEPSDARQFEVQRETVAVAADIAVGAISLRGTVGGLAPDVTAAESDGEVFSVDAFPGDEVVAGQRILRFRASPTDAEAIQLEILRLEITLAEAEGDTSALAEAEESLAAFETEISGRGQDIFATSAGVLRGTRTIDSYRVRAGEPLFEVTDPATLAVLVEISGRESSSIVGEDATVRADALSPPVGGVVMSVRFDEEQNRTTVTIDGVPTESELGDQVFVELAVPQATTSDRLWIPAEALHRRSGNSFVLLEREDLSLQRIDVDVVRRTDSHIEVASIGQAGIHIVPGSKLVVA